MTSGSLSIAKSAPTAKHVIQHRRERQITFTQEITRMSMASDEPIPPKKFPGLRPLPQLIFSSRWLQLPLYLGLIVAQCVYVTLFLKELWHLVLGALKFTGQ